MQIIEIEDGGVIICQGFDAERKKIDAKLLGIFAKGDWVLVFLNSAREVITKKQAEQIHNALMAVSLVMQDHEANVDHLFADLVNREPRLPKHLRRS